MKCKWSEVKKKSDERERGPRTKGRPTRRGRFPSEVIDVVGVMKNHIPFPSSTPPIHLTICPLPTNVEDEGAVSGTAAATRATRREGRAAWW